MLNGLSFNRMATIQKTDVSIRTPVNSTRTCTRTHGHSTGNHNILQNDKTVHLASHKARKVAFSQNTSNFFFLHNFIDIDFKLCAFLHHLKIE